MLGPLDLDWICHLDILQYEMENILAYNNSSACRHCLSGQTEIGDWVCMILY